MHPVIIALFNGLGNIWGMVYQNNKLLELILIILFYFVFKDVIKAANYAWKKGWFARSEFDK